MLGDGGDHFDERRKRSDFFRQALDAFEVGAKLNCLLAKLSFDRRDGRLVLLHPRASVLGENLPAGHGPAYALPLPCRSFDKASDLLNDLHHLALRLCKRVADLMMQHVDVRF